MLSSITPPTSATCGPPPPIATYADVAAATAAIQEHARVHGYAFTQRDKQPKRVVFICDRGGVYNNKGKSSDVHQSKRRKNTASKKCGCLMKVALRRSPKGWALEVIEASHNHGPSIAAIAHSAHRIAALGSGLQTEIDQMARNNLSTAQILSYVRQDSAVLLTSKDVVNIVQKARLIELNGKTPIQWLMEVYYPCFIY
jgi:hypothetical protein